ncbi:hypothetical protein BD780_004310 [Clostridium tetanomorphum]|uniref:hypothetical protein n=1 Tax=Clostridium tetanomorphum TaxID=1553 RepID=UPI00044B0141|nr:hypothetical protein [Clostridium tetanomorphum]KAJ52028.1 hypothetical protein CTM_09656 [Clostridium tetanomorphum DSM 665]MBP1862948.1 hypothetical protein [Clostridium tetanomorphum]NRS87085.1 hypothetical protein [Clostridium tetanomorphum]SQC00103.1 Uncharacterised protein [Clostridium tetanomorphum]
MENNYNKNPNEIFESNIDSNKKDSSSNKGYTNEHTSDYYDKDTDDLIAKMALRIRSINLLREELIKLELNPKARLYFDNDVNPLLTTLLSLSATSLNLSTSSSLLSTSIIVHSKDSKIKDTINLIYSINEQCEDIYKVLKRKVKILIDISCNP